MNSQITILSVAILFGVLNLGFSLICYRKQRGQRILLEFAEKQIEDLELALTKSRENLETNAQRVAEQSRRIAWLETRVRQPKPAVEEVVDENAETPKINMTERRHRVIALAAKGLNAETIAGTLGIMPGEVELIINLNQAAINK